ncbi:MAG: hypothetical protein ACI9OJ_002870 [Myxococcota bacterium]|jgi:hypothetical protein
MRFETLPLVIIAGLIAACGLDSEPGELAQDPSTTNGGQQLPPNTIDDSVHPIDLPFNPYVVPVVDQPITLSEPVLISSGSKFSDLLGLSEDGSQIAYARDRSGMGGDVYSRDLESDETRLVGENVMVVIPNSLPVLRSDGRSALFRTVVDGGGSWHAMEELWQWDWSSGRVSLVHEAVFRGGYGYANDIVIFAEATNRDLHVMFPGEASIVVDTDVWVPSWETSPFKQSPDHETLAYVTGSTGKGTLTLLDLTADLPTPEVIGEQIESRTVRFDESGDWLVYSEDLTDGVWTQFRLSDGARFSPGHTYHALHSPTWQGVAFLSDIGGKGNAAGDTGDAGQLRYYDVTTGESTVIAESVLRGHYQFSADGNHLVYGTRLDWSAGQKLTGELWIADLTSNTRALVATDFAMFSSTRLDRVAVSANGTMVAYRNAAGHARLRIGNEVVTMSTLSSFEAMWFTPDQSAVVMFDRHAQVVERYDLASRTLAPILSDASYVSHSPSLVYSVFARRSENSQLASSVVALTVVNWVTGALQTIEGESMSPKVVTDSHLGYSIRVDGHYSLYLLELP